MNTDELHNILKQGESEILEFKSSFNNEVIEALVAFSNSIGGRVGSVKTGCWELF